MLPAICAFVLSLSSFGSDPVELQVVQLQENICEFFANEHAVVEVSDKSVESKAEVTEEESSEVVVVETDVIKSEHVEPNLAPEVMPETDVAEPATAAPAFEIAEDDIVVESVQEQIAEEEIAGHVAATAGEEVVEPSVSSEPEIVEISEIEELLGAWPQLSEETRLSILTLIRIDNGVE